MKSRWWAKCFGPGERYNMTRFFLFFACYGTPTAVALNYIGTGWLIAALLAAYISAVMAEQRRLELRDGPDPTGANAFSRMSAENFDKSNTKIMIGVFVRLGVVAAIYYGISAI